jgi:hypothetical protein
VLAALLVAAPLVAQQPDSVPSRVPLPADTTKKDSVRTDTIKAPIAVAPRPALPEVEGRRVRWDRAAIFQSGALTLPELLAQVPGTMMYQAAHIAAPTALSWYGEPGRVRVFLDGVAMDPLDPRDGSVQDLAPIQLFSLEEVAVERLAGELRVHLRSWRVDRTTPQTRTDVVTGSEETNLYRGYFGKRLFNGAVMQVAAQQYSTTSARTGGDGDAISAFARLGVARGPLTVDGVVTRMGRTRFETKRNLVSGTPTNDAIAGFVGRDLAAYLRAAWGSPDTAGFWMQVVAATLSHAETGDTLAGRDTAVSTAQYVATAGITRWGARLSAAGRLRVRAGATSFSPELRGSWENRLLSVSASVDGRGADSTARTDVLALLSPFPWLQFSGAHSIHAPDDELVHGPSRTVSRVEAALRLKGRWVRAGLVQRSASLSPGLPVFDSMYVPLSTPATTGIEAGIAGPIWGPFSLEWRGIRWSEEVAYRPFVESHTALRVHTGFERKLTRRVFDLDAALFHEYRGRAEFPASPGTGTRAEGAGFLGGMLEIRIGNAHVFWYNRNMTGKVYETVPGYLMPRLVQLYGLRWEFWN